MVLELSCKGGGEFGVHYSHSKKLFYGRRILTLWNQRTPFMGFMQQLSVQDLRVFQFRPFIPLTTSSRYQVAATIYAGSKRAIFAVINGWVNPYWGRILIKVRFLSTTYLINNLSTYINYLLPIKELYSNRSEHFQVILPHSGFSSWTILLTHSTIREKSTQQQQRRGQRRRRRRKEEFYFSSGSNLIVSPVLWRSFELHSWFPLQKWSFCGQGVSNHS